MSIIERLKRRNSYTTEFDEEIPVVNFEKVGMKDLRSLTPYKVGQVVGNNWLPNGLIAWNVVDGGNKLNLVYFKGRVAVITTIANPKMDINEILRQASRICQIDDKRIVHMNLCA